MRIPYLDLSVSDSDLKSELLAAVDTVLTHGRILLGPEVSEFEDSIARRSERRYGVGVSSGTEALHMTLRGLGIGPGDEVITTSMSWIATANAITVCGATPVFVDVGEDLNIDPLAIEAAITSRTRAIVPVHFTGKMADMPRIIEIAESHGLHVIEDAAQAFSASLNGRPAGSFGAASCFSMNPMKVLNAYGEAGAIVTDDDELAERLVSLRYGGTVNKEDCVYPSLNGRIDTLQAAMLLVSLRRLDAKVARRREIADRYSALLGEVVTCPRETSRQRDIYYSYTIIADQRTELIAHLAANGIETKIQHKILMPYHTAYKGKFHLDIPTAERLVGQILCIPNHENMADDEVDFVSDKIREFYK
jgi:dTDP-4-amino-4,6-dideoxygalactose transaminase